MRSPNPFILSTYAGPRFFCNRQKETAFVIDAIKNNRNLTLISYRRLGKSGLIKHVFHKLRNEKGMQLLYIDLMDTEDLSGFVQLLAKEIIGKVDGHTLRFIKSFGQAIKSLRPQITVDPLTGRPEIEISMQPDASPEITLKEVFTYLQKQKKQIVIALDEFQQILEYPEKNTEAVLRKYIQQLTNTCFIYSGSRKHLLTSMFSDSGRPFFQSTDFLNLTSIENSDYNKFISSWFKKDGREIDQEAVQSLLTLSRGHTYYVQFLSNKIYGLQLKSTNKEHVIQTLIQILEEKEFIYYNYKKLLTGLQFKLLEAIAIEDGIDKPTSKKFINEHKLGTPSSVKTALTALLEKEMIFEDNKYYHVYDVFFSLWLNRRKIN
jgi:AAA+ ATPase superfamily predicted ATPase